MKIEIGTLYRMRNGGKAIVHWRAPNKNYVWHGSCKLPNTAEWTEVAWHESGLYWQETEHQVDLIAPWEEPVQQPQIDEHMFKMMQKELLAARKVVDAVRAMTITESWKSVDNNDPPTMVKTRLEIVGYKALFEALQHYLHWNE